MRLRTLIIFGAGYVWGARAGREPFDELVERTRGFLDSDFAHNLVERVKVAWQPADDGSGEEGEEQPEEDSAEDAEEESEDEGSEDGERDSEEETSRSRSSSRKRTSERKSA